MSQSALLLRRSFSSSARALSLAETFKTWTAMETIIPVVGIVRIMPLSTIVG